MSPDMDIKDRADVVSHAREMSLAWIIRLHENNICLFIIGDIQFCFR